MKYKIGRELLVFHNTENHIQELDKYYKEFRSGKRPISVLNNDYIDDHDLLYMSIQYLVPFNEISNDDVMKHYCFVGTGFNINILKREKVFSILDSKSNFLQKIKTITKSKIFDILRLNQQYHFNEKAEHYFIGGQYSVVFEIQANIFENEIFIEDVYVGEKHERDEYRSSFYKSLIETTI